MAGSGTELGTAYVQIIPTASGIRDMITKEIGGDAEEAGKKSGEGFSSAFGGALSAIGTAIAGAIAAGSAAVGTIIKDSVTKYADYEQLVGGVETLFEDSAGTVQKYAENAFKTAGMSANEYMETVTSFSASLLQSLGGDTEAAARVGDMAISDMADNANKMGSSMESIQNAYQGFAKQNYTMLDNLKLGYGGTKEEMERLLEDASKISGIEYDISSLSDVYEAIHVVQEEMGITGTTAAEASETISGSLATMGAAWDNLVTGMADPDADMGALIGNFAESAVTAAENIIPRVGEALSGLGDAVTGLAPVLSDAVETVTTDVLPGVLEGAASLVGAVGGALLESAPELLQTALDLGMSIAEGLADPESIQAVTDSAVEILTTFIDWLADNAPQLIDVAVTLILELAAALINADNIGKIVDSALRLILALADGLIDALPKLIAKAPEIVGELVEAVIENAPKLLDAALELIGKLIEGIGNGFQRLIDAGSEIVEKVKDGFTKSVEDAKNWGRDMINNFVSGISAKWQDLKSSVSGVAQTVRSYLHFSEPDVGPLSDFSTYAPDMMELFAEGIRQNQHLITDEIDSAFDIGPQMIDVGARQSMRTFAPAQQQPEQSALSPMGGTLPPLTLDVTMMLDGAVLARRQFSYNVSEAAMRGASYA